MIDSIFKALIYLTLAAACLYLAAENYHDLVRTLTDGY